MPYVNGKRVSNAEWQKLYATTTLLHTSERGVNPASGPDIDPDTGAPKPKTKAGGNRSKNSAKKARAAIADALGVKEDSAVLADIDVSGLDAPAPNEDPE